MRVCTKCRVEKPVSEFSIRRDTASGRSSGCKLCLNKQGRDRHKEHPEIRKTRRLSIRSRRKELRGFLDSLKNTPCADCGNSYPACAMDFDHIDAATKEYDLSTAVSRGRSKENIMLEAAKCQVVCSCCHRIREHSRRLVAEGVDGTT